MRYSGLRSSKWLIFAILASIYFFVYFHRTSPAVMANDLMLEFSVSALAIGILSSLYFYPYAVLQIPVGVLSDVKGAKKVVVSFTLLTLIGIVLFVTATNFEIAVLSRLLIGIGVSGVYIPTVKIMSQWFRANEFATAMGILFAIGNLGAIFSSYPLAVSIESFGWRISFAIFGAITAALLLLCLFFVKDAPPEFKKENLKREDFKLLFNLTLWLLATSAMLRYGIVMGFQGLWGGPFLIDVANLSKVLAGTVLMLFAIGAIIGAPLLGRISDELGLRKALMIVSGIGFTIFWLPLTLYPEKLGIVELSIISFMLGFFSSAGPIAYTMVKEQFPLRMTGLAVSFINVFPFVGAGIFQTIMGYLMDSVGKLGEKYPVEAYKLSFEFCLVASVVSLILLFFVKEDRQKF
ncbi:MAG: MFS transporter [Archaeoglobaceae archaeon]